MELLCLQAQIFAFRWGSWTEINFPYLIYFKAQLLPQLAKSKYEFIWY